MLCLLIKLNNLQVLYVADTRQKGSPAVTFAQGHGLDGPWGMVAGKKLDIGTILL